MPGIITSRRSFLLGSVSTGALVAAENLLETIHKPGIEAMTAVVRSIASLITQQPGLIGIDLCDLRTVLEGGGQAGFGQGVRGK